MTMGESRNAFSTAWQDVKHSPKWLGRMCLLALVSLIPIFGPIAVAGYVTGWARDAAWNLRQPMPERVLGNADGRQYSRGFFAWLLHAVYAFVPAFLLSLLGAAMHAAMGDGSLAAGMTDGLFGLAGLAVGVLATFVAWAGIMRMSIYGTLSSGFQVKKAWAMLSQDWGGVLRIFGLALLWGFIVFLAFTLALMAVVLLLGGFGVAALAASVGAGAGDAIAAVIGAVAVPMVMLLVLLCFAAGYLLTVAGIALATVQWRAIGYWASQLRPDSWRGQADPMPFELEEASAGADRQ